MPSLNSITLTLVFTFSVITCFVLGFLVRQAITNKVRKRMLELENEMLANHEEILRLESVLAKLSPGSTHSTDTPIINLNGNKNQQKTAN
jgi:hypothetical protein